MLDYQLPRFAARHFPGITRRKDRERAGELRLVEMYFEAVGVTGGGQFIDVGANLPRDGSQTWDLEQKGWRGLLIEPLPELCEELRRERKSTVIQAACGAPGSVADGPRVATLHVGATHSHATLQPGAVTTTAGSRTVTVPLVTLDDILAQHPLPGVDLVSIDVEGFQLDVLRGFTLEQHRPRMLLVEDHLLGYATHRHMTRHGYTLVKRTGLNNWYIPRGEPFTLTDPLERLLMWHKVFIKTPFRALRHRVRGHKR